MNCPKCNSHVTPTQKFCGRCGSELKNQDEKLKDRHAAASVYLSKLVVAMHNLDALLGEGSKQLFYDHVAELVSAELKKNAREIGYEASTGLMLLHIIAGEAVFSEAHLETFLPRLVAFQIGEGRLVPHDGNFRAEGI